MWAIFQESGNSLIVMHSLKVVGQPFWHNATSYFKKFGCDVIGRTIRFSFKVFNETLDFICISRS